MERNETVYRSIIGVSIAAIVGVGLWVFAHYGLQAMEISKETSIENIKVEGKKDIERMRLTLQKEIEEYKHKQWLYRSQAIGYQWKSDSIRQNANAEAAKYQWKSDSVRAVAKEKLRD